MQSLISDNEVRLVAETNWEKSVLKQIRLITFARTFKINGDQVIIGLTKDSTAPPAAQSEEHLVQNLQEVVDKAEEAAIRNVLKITDHRAKAAEILGISRKNLWEKMKKYDIVDTDPTTS